jgi:hypothetical protein
MKMNRQTALKILELPEQPANSERDIKNAYRTKILQFHPDKNKSPEASAKFMEVQEAYTLLSNTNLATPIGGESYKDMLNAFLKTIFREEGASKLTELICKKICRAVENNTDHVIDYLRNINHDTVKLIRDILVKYRHILSLSPNFFELIDEIIDGYAGSHDKYIMLNPELEDLFSEENIYVLKYDDRSYLVPLWHHEMAFQKDEDSAQNIVVRNYPILPDNMELDEFNVLTIHLQYCLLEVWDREVVVDVGGKKFVIFGNTLRLTDAPQRIEYPDCGVPYNNLDDIFDTSKKQSVVFIITIVR